MLTRDASLELLEDPSGGWSARQSAIDHELDAYRSQLSSRLNEFPLYLLSTDLPPMRVEGLVGTYQVALPTPDNRSDGLAEVCRRWGRVVVVGLPGSGKSTALQQIAASWASRDDAPVPILVALRPFLRHVEGAGKTISLARLIEHAVSSADRDASILVPELLRRCDSGEAALLLDGLDECRGKAASVADAVMNIATAMPSLTSVILSTRKSARPAASKLGLPEVELIEPYRLEATLDSLLEHVARCRTAEPKRRSWIKERSHRLEEVRSETSQLLRVPLMAVLLTLLVAEKGAPRHGAGRAELLAELVKGSVKRWESSKPKADSPTPDLEAGMLLDAFAEIGHTVAVSGNTTRNGVEEAVAAQFGTGWGRAPRDSSEAAQVAVSFWDDQVGVFVSLPPDGPIEPRSRVFVEIAEAMWIARQPVPTMRQWLSDAMAEADRRETVLLAAGLRSEIVELLIDASQTKGAEAVALAADALSAGSSVPPSAQQRLVDLIEASLSNENLQSERDANTHADESAFQGIMRTIAIRQARRDGPYWPMACRLAQLPLDASLWERRARIIDGISSQERRVLGHALSAIAQIEVRGGKPSEVEVERMISLLREPLPVSETRSRPVSRRHLVVDGPSWSPLSGFGDAVIGCLKWLPVVDEALAKLAWRAAQHTSAGNTIRVEQLLAQSGHGAVMAMTNLEGFAGMANLFPEDPWESMRPYFGIVAGAASPSKLTLAQAWRLEGLSSLTKLVGLAELTIGTLGQAFSRARAEMEFLIPLFACRAGLDAGVLAAEAEVAAEAHDRGAGREIVGILFVNPAPGREVSLRSGPLEGGMLNRLMEILRGGVELPFILAARVLFSAQDQAVGDSVLSILGEIPTWHRGRAARLVVLLAANQVETVLSLLTGDDSVVRVSAASLVPEMIDEDPEEERLRASLDELANSKDFSLRAALFGEIESKTDAVDLERLLWLAQGEPKYWTCCDCGREQALGDLDCRECRTGTRPELPKGLGASLAWYARTAATRNGPRRSA